MSKKEYRKPTLRVMTLENIDMVCMSPDAPSTFGITDDYVDNYGDHEHGADTKDIWGSQW